MQTLNFTSVPTHFGEARLSTVKASDWRAGEPQSPFTERIQFFNHSPVPVVICRRDGLKFTLPSIPSFKENQLIVRSEITIGAAVKKDIERVLSAVTDQDTLELRLLRDAYERQVAVNTYEGATLVLDYPISKDTLWSMGGTAYYNELDLLVSLLPIDEVPPHPQSEAGKRSTVALDHESTGFGYSIRMVDNAQRHGCRYINFSGVVYRIVPVLDVQLRDGVYITSNVPAEDGRVGAGQDAVNVRRCSFEIAERDFGLYKTYEEAVSLGDMAAGRKQQLLQLEHEVATSKIELQRMKTTHERELGEVNLQLRKMEHERDVLDLRRKALEHALEMEKMAKKDHYEDKSYQRKDQSEVLKILPTIVVGIGALILALSKLFSGSKASIVR